MPHRVTRAVLAAWLACAALARRLHATNTTALACKPPASSGWLLPAANLSSPSKYYMAHRLHTSAAGNVSVVAWELYTDSNQTVVQAAVAGTSAAWGEPTTLSTNGDAPQTKVNAGAVEVAVAANGHAAAAIWSLSGPMVIQVSIASIAGASATWGKPVNLSDGRKIVRGTGVGLSTNGRAATAAWSTSNSLHVASAAVDGDNVTWSTPVEMATADVHDATFGVSADASKVVALWTDGTNWPRGGLSLKTATAVASGTSFNWTAESTLATNITYGDYQQLAVSADGTRAVAMWLRDMYTMQAATAVLSNASVRWSAPVTLANSAAHTVKMPSVGLSSNGGVVVALWERKKANDVNGTLQCATATIASNGDAKWGAADTVPLPGTGGEDDMGWGWPVVAVSSDGTKAAATWLKQRRSGDVAHAATASIARSSTKWSLPATPLTPRDGNATGSDWFPLLALSADGKRARVAWTRGRRGSSGKLAVVQAATYAPCA